MTQKKIFLNLRTLVPVSLFLFLANSGAAQDKSIKTLI
jgi:hypothetical protein